MTDEDKKAKEAVVDLISELATKMKEIDLNSIKKISESQNAALGLIVCCTGSLSQEKNPSKKVKKNKNKK